MGPDTAKNQNINTLSYLEDNDYAKAVTSSLTALSYRTSESTSATQRTTSEALSNGISLDQCMLLLKSFKNDEDDDMDDNTNQVFIYDHGIPLPQEQTTTEPDPTIITPILIFNAALAHHLFAQAKGATTEDLQRAKRLYEIAYGSQTVAENVLFRFAVINNIAVIDRQLGNTEQAEQQIRQLMSVLMLFVDQNRAAELRHLRGFLVNLHTTSKTAGAA